jgi:hypothetical protein
MGCEYVLVNEDLRLRMLRRHGGDFSQQRACECDWEIEDPP